MLLRGRTKIVASSNRPQTVIARSKQRTHNLTIDVLFVRLQDGIKKGILLKTVGSSQSSTNFKLEQLSKMTLMRSLLMLMCIHLLSSMLNSPPVMSKRSNVRGVSTYIYAFYGHRPVHIVLDTSATSSLISSSFAKAAGIPIAPILHSARAADKSSLTINGEIWITLDFSDTSSAITTLPVDSLDCDVFYKENDIQVHLKNEQITIKSTKISYEWKPPSLCHDIYCTQP